MKIHKLNGYIQSIYLVQNEDELLLLDGCCRCDINRVEDFITQKLQMSMSSLKLIVVTHMHPDHAGAAASLRRKYNCKIAGSELGQSWYKGIVGVFRHFLDLVLTLYVAKKMNKKARNVYFSKTLKVDYYLKDQSPLPGFEDWVALERPGHTNCDLSLYHKDSSQIYIADNIIKTRTKLIAPYPIHYPAIYKKSLESYLDLDIKTYLLAHGGCLSISRDDLSRFLNEVSDQPTNHKQLIKKMVNRSRKKGGSLLG